MAASRCLRRRTSNIATYRSCAPRPGCSCWRTAGDRGSVSRATARSAARCH
jgi:hypothetical protein